MATEKYSIPLRNLPVVNRKWVYRIMAQHTMILEKHTAVRIGRVHDGMVMRSSLR